ncbi:MAG: aspartyl/asparaginyl beta-hydroxylase domain-containing protein [Acidobacteria bacterium]|nr:aspartyl/asparaginyl beta-hydroxylase domain-containing protein [Acidobacteriota bacterium]
MTLSSYKLPLAFDAAALKADLGQVAAGDWVRHFNRGYYVGEWKGLALRSTTGRANQLFTPAQETAETVETPVLERCPYFRQVLAAFECPLHTARLLSLGPGSKILEHKDDFLSGEDGLFRVHVPVATDERVEFFVGGRRLSMSEGEAWWVDFSLPHHVTNGSDRDRVHLVIDCRVNDWLAGLLPRGGDLG